jgi:putative ABC transport system substrate-binding protein
VKRRAFITLLGGAAVWPLAARAEQISKPARLGYIWIGAKDSEHSTRDGLRQGLRDLGYLEGRDFILEERYAESQPDRLPEIVAELVRLNVALFLSPGVQVTRALMAGTSTIPIIATAPDLLSSGFVASLARPGGNVTGMSLTASPTLFEKWLEILKETFPQVSTVAILTAAPFISIESKRQRRCLGLGSRTPSGPAVHDGHMTASDFGAAGAIHT